jgi:hypothetical protein
MKRELTTHHLIWFLDLYRNNELDLEPSYQRKVYGYQSILKA